MEEFIQFFDAWHLDVLDWGILAGVSFVIYVWMGEKCLRNLFAYECSAILCAAPIFLIALVSVVIGVLFVLVSEYLLQEKIWGYLLFFACLLYCIPKVTDKMKATEAS